MSFRIDPIYRHEECERCGGDGLVTILINEVPTEVPCNTCNGLGSIIQRIEESKLLKANYIRAHEIMDATTASEYNALSDANKDAYRQIISCGIVDLTEGTGIRTKLWNMFDEESETRTALIALLGE